MAGTLSERLKKALTLPNGARFYRCALQVNPFAYQKRHNNENLYKTEADYNAAIIAACHETGIEVIGVTDHYRVQESASLVAAARQAGLFAFSGFEAVSKDGVHFLCLFDPNQDEMLERYIGECGVYNSDSLSPTGILDSSELLEKAKQWGGICIAAHVAGGGGLLRKLSGASRVNVWKQENLLLACALTGAISKAPDGIRQILENKELEYKRVRPVAVINASDINGPNDLKKDGSSCFIKMSAVSIEAFRQAFLDPKSRVRLNSDLPSEPHTELLAMTWDGGFLADTAVHFTGNLNVLIGGRGTGKSTMIESMRYVLGLEPLGEEARKAHEGVIRYVLKSGTKISLLIRSHRPSERCYTIERTVPNPPAVKDENGEVLTLTPRDIAPGIEVFGQHEISELTKSREKLTLLLERFVDRDPNLSGRKAKVHLELERSRSRVVDVQREMKALDERLAALPSLEETQKRFKESGLEERLKERGLLVREERIFVNVAERLQPIQDIHDVLVEELPLDTAFVSSKALEGLPSAELLVEIQQIFDTLSKKLKNVTTLLNQVLNETNDAISKTRTGWDARKKVIVETYEKLLRELQKSKIDGAEFIKLRQQIEALRPLREKKKQFKRDLAAHESHRRKLLAEWVDIQGSEYREIEKAAKKVSRKLNNRVGVEVTMAGNREPLEGLLREVGGNLSAALDRLSDIDQLSLQDFAQRCREGKEALIQHYKLPAGSAERISHADIDLFMRIEELDLPATTKIELNTAPDGATPIWQTLEALSTGQKATAVLLLLLLESDAPLVVDQPEDDLDNRFITEGVVPIMREEKHHRQFIFSTHNANIPVLGDAELIVGLVAAGEAKEGHAQLSSKYMGSIDSTPVREMVEEILEGGKDAFEMRRSKYGF